MNSNYCPLRQLFYNYFSKEKKITDEPSMSEKGPPPPMLWPTAVAQDAFMDFSRSPSRDGKLDSPPEQKTREKEKNNKVSPEISPRKEPLDLMDTGKKEELLSMKEMKERIKMKTGVFRKHLTEYLKDMSPSSAAAPTFDTEDNNKCIVWDDKGRIKHATLLKIVEKLTSEKHTGIFSNFFIILIIQ
jgi:hypothetical protein